MSDCLKFLICLFAISLCSCSPQVAGTTEENNGLAREETNSQAEISSSSAQFVVAYSSSILIEIPVSSSGSVVDPSTGSSGYVDTLLSGSGEGIGLVDSGTTAKLAMHAPYWYPYWKDGQDEGFVDLDVETTEEESVNLTYTLDMPAGAWDPPMVGGFGLAIRVEGDDSTAFTRMKTWTQGVCMALWSVTPIVLKIGLSPEKERELGYDLPQIDLVTDSSAGSGNMIINCKSWSEFKQRGTGPVTISGTEAFAQMTSLKFEVVSGRGLSGAFEIVDLYAYGSTIMVGAGDADLVFSTSDN